MSGGNARTSSEQRIAELETELRAKQVEIELSKKQVRGWRPTLKAVAALIVAILVSATLLAFFISLCSI
ncbi:hypothetical protein WJX72_011764 [[Myrmecia] bisecta]|uniref:Uncharacterized protein n=1 Tax=[Myrmecia] bisecta TaxID=41462 RepID=A0AAW1QGP5_9CHLO